MKALAQSLFSALTVVLALIIAAGPFIFPTVADGDPITNSISAAWLVYFYGIFIGLHLSLRVSHLNDSERKRREWLLDFYPFWSMPIFIGIYRIVYLIRDSLGH